ncbi:MAG: serine/threonine protein kinase [Burkholderiales bacterium]|nr:serine/threonine protein kinase [Burkholderiales bacterium]
MAVTAPPRVLAGYRIETVLARGAASVVYLARKPQQAQWVALKTASAPGSDFSREFRLACVLDHPNVLRAIEHGTAGGTGFLAMEYAAGGHLGNCGAIDAPRLLSLLRQAASALARVHSLGWVHRDVKPANLLVRGDGSLALADFGSLCGNGDGDPQRARVAGTPVYCAPEQSRGDPAGPGADIYSLGAVLYQLLCGQPPFPGQTPTELLCQHLVAPVPALPARHAAWQPLVDAMLAKDPLQRPASGQAVFAKLQQAAHLLCQPCRPGSPGGVEESS